MTACLFPSCEHLCVEVLFVAPTDRPLGPTHTQEPALSIAESSPQDRNLPDPWTQFLVYQAPHLQSCDPDYINLYWGSLCPLVENSILLLKLTVFCTLARLALLNNKMGCASADQ